MAKLKFLKVGYKAITKQYLKTVFAYYKQKYNLKTRLKFQKKNTYFSHRKTLFISYAIPFVEEAYPALVTQRLLAKNKKVRKTFSKDMRYALKFWGDINLPTLKLWMLLHEIKHAIDYEKNPAKYYLNFRNLDRERYETEFEYHNKQSFEKRANSFAKRELKRWIK